MKLRTLGVATAMAATSVLAACGGDDDGSNDETTAAPASSAPAESGTSAMAFNEADVTFAQGMIAHHQQAIEMAEIALDPTVGARPEIVDLAGRIATAQTTEIDQMTGWLTAWGESVTMDTSGGHDMSSMEGMMTAEEMDALAALTGADFDTMWLEMMIEHHEGAIAQAQTVTADGMDQDTRILADQIVTAQQAEIETMRGLLAG